MAKAKKQKAVEEKPVPDPRLGKLVRYYDEGWRHGHLEELKGGVASVRPLAAYKAAVGRCAKVPAEHIEIA